jgi:glycosyltransferase involved in cell wall biosynthesis
VTKNNPHFNNTHEIGIEREQDNTPSRILMLVPHEPEKDPRIKWVTRLCSQIGRTDILGFTSTNEKPLREYDGIIYLERIQVDLYSSKTKKIVYLFLNLLQYGSARLRRIIRFAEGLRQSGKEPSLRTNILTISSSSSSQPHKKTEETKLFSSIPKTITGIIKRMVYVYRFILRLSFYYFIVDALYQRARTMSIIPRVIICHDIYALAAGAKIKRMYQCPLIYDSHELWPEANLEAKNWEKKVTAFIEHKFIQYADKVITVTPQIARHLEYLYGITGILIAANAEPFNHSMSRSCDKPLSLPIKFLFQGNASMGRGMEEFLELWSRLKDDRAILILRAPENDYYKYLQSRFQREINAGRIVISPPVAESDLIAVASLADIGVIPYGGPSLNHIFACPNKLSQYMHAGLAVLCNQDMEFVCNIVRRYECGLTYNATKPEIVIAALQSLINAPQHLQSMKNNAYKAARSEFNWEVQSKDYYQAIYKLYHHME